MESTASATDGEHGRCVQGASELGDDGAYFPTALTLPRGIDARV